MTRLRPLIVPLLLAVAAVLLYDKRVRHEMVDFGVYRQAAERGLRAEPLYRVEDGHYQFKYLPAFAFAVAPTALMTAETAKMAWFAFSFCLLVIFMRWSVVAVPERRLSSRALLWIGVLLMAKFFARELLLGQSNLLLGSLLVGALLAAQIDQPIVAGALIGCAVFVKPYALVFVPWLAITRGVRAASTSVAIVVIGLAAPALVYGWGGNLDLLANWYRTVTDSTAPNLVGADNISLAGMWAKWLGPGVTATRLTAVSAAGALGLVALAWRRRTDMLEPDYLEFGLLMLLIPLLSPQGWDYVLLLATPAVLCLVDRWREMSAAWRIVTATALALMCLTIFDIMGRTLYAQFMALSIVTVSALALAVSLVHLRWRALA